MNAIETHRLTKRFRRLGTYRDLILYPWRHDDHLAVDDLSLEVAEGELFGLLGENGAGKTTFIRMLSTTLLPTSGTALVAGHDVVHDPLRVRQHIGVVSGEERSFYWRLTGRQNLQFFSALYHLGPAVARRRIDALLEVVGITDFADEPFYTYSTGTRHKLSIVRGLLTEPHVLFLDEPTRSLDAEAVLDVRRLLTEYVVGELGRTVLLTTHSLAEAEAVCDRVAIIRAGRLVAGGTIPELRARMRLSAWCEIVLSGPYDGLLRELGDLPGVEEVSADVDQGKTRLTMHLGRRDGVLDHVLRRIQASGAVVESCTTREPALEEIYRQVLASDREANVRPRART